MMLSTPEATNKATDKLRYYHSHTIPIPIPISPSISIHTIPLLAVLSGLDIMHVISHPKEDRIEEKRRRRKWDISKPHYDSAHNAYNLITTATGDNINLIVVGKLWSAMLTAVGCKYESRGSYFISCDANHVT
ncbi:hypothetical protein VE01_10822 [Pseudogymnoascus verrucosus]|uniref:Uncharacterized protein n=1 Tax=Pseudogymnoascus verrucosus TaxID=342668 RepID=A0A2P6FH12_9PEZI|nr:uncharacterized protein VE01_10822 [Pseudogymnoascus verrucosus]PQM43926.1 hypothetical protein VE01_10822 [Pseudogymnoascus verrucosus]